MRFRRQEIKIVQNLNVLTLGPTEQIFCRKLQQNRQRPDTSSSLSNVSIKNSHIEDQSRKNTL